jgi:hypothetical protein
MTRPDRLHRRVIQAALIKQHGWSVNSHVDGWIDVHLPPRTDPSSFAKEVRLAVASMGYEPSVVIGPGRRVIRVRTPETLKQDGRGEHGAGAPRPTAGSVESKKPELTTRERAAPALVIAVDAGADDSTAKDVAHPGTWVDAIRPTRPPYLRRLSNHSDLVTWHAEVTFDSYAVTPEEAARWKVPDADARETWRKRPLVIGRDSGCVYSCGEVELAARFRTAGYEAFWITEWSGFPHWPAWQPFCVKRSELRARLPHVWEHDRALRERFPDLALGKGGGHPDIVAWQPGSQDLFFAEYKGPGDSLKPKQNSWARALTELDGRSRYVAAIGQVR